MKSAGYRDRSNDIERIELHPTHEIKGFPRAAKRVHPLTQLFGDFINGCLIVY
jgi:hypothetical protein